MPNVDPLVTPERAAEILGVKVQTLANWRATKRYPLTYIKLGSAVRYRLSDLEAFIDGQAVSRLEC